MKELQTVLNNILADKNTNLKPENLKKGVTCLGVTGTLEASTSSGGVKQFSTVEEMNSSTGNTEGDLAVVYKNEIQNATVDSKFQVATFPDTVVLDTAITGYVEVRYRAVDSSVMFDCWGSLDSSGFSMDCYTETGNIRIEYTSTDGITYTRTDTTGNPVDFGTKIYYEMTEMWNDAIGKFIEVGSSSFNGIYKYSGLAWKSAPTQLTATVDDVYEKEFYGKNGVEEGTLGTNPSNLFDDSVASIVYSANEAYAAMEPLKITSANKDTISDNIRFIPVNSQGEALLDVSELADVQTLFANKIYLKDIPCKFGNVAYMSSMCNGCSNLITFPYVNATNSQHANYLCDNCTNLKNVPVMDFANTKTWPNAFSGCPNLSDESLNNILAICISATKSETKTLKYIGLTSAQATKCTTLSNYSAFTAAGWTTGY